MAFHVVLRREAAEFLDEIPYQAADKMNYNIHRVMLGERNPEIFKKLENSDIWEIRALWGGIAYRLLAFWDSSAETLVIATHGFVKKTQKTPAK